MKLFADTLPLESGFKPGGTAHVPSALRKLVVPPPDNGAKPFKVLVNIGSMAFTCATVRSAALAVPPVLLPLIVRVAICARLELVTVFVAIVAATDWLPEAGPARICPVSWLIALTVTTPCKPFTD